MLLLNQTCFYFGNNNNLINYKIKLLNIKLLKIYKYIKNNGYILNKSYF